MIDFKVASMEQLSLNGWYVFQWNNDGSMCRMAFQDRVQFQLRMKNLRKAGTKVVEIRYINGEWEEVKNRVNGKK